MGGSSHTAGAAAAAAARHGATAVIKPAQGKARSEVQQGGGGAKCSSWQLDVSDSQTCSWVDEVLCQQIHFRNAACGKSCQSPTKQQP
jgi:hypothetical protein